MLITFDITLSVSYAKTATTLYKVTKVSSNDSLHIRKWPGAKSRITASLPFNAKNIKGTGKRKTVGRSKWLEVKWKNNRGWVNSRFLKRSSLKISAKKKSSRNKKVVRSRKLSRSTQKRQVSSRNTRATPIAKSRNRNRRAQAENQMETPPIELFGGDRYDQTIEVSAREVRASYIPKKK